MSSSFYIIRAVVIFQSIGFSHGCHAGPCLAVWQKPLTLRRPAARVAPLALAEIPEDEVENINYICGYM